MLDPFSVPILSTRDLARSGATSRQIERRVEARELVRLRRGVFAAGIDWMRLRPEGRRVLRARAWAQASVSDPVFSHATAAALHGLPVFRARDERTHVLVPSPRARLAPDISRHRGTASSGVIRIRGLLVTDLARTVADVGRFETAEASIAIADAALRAVDRDPDAPAITRFRDRALEFLPPHSPGAAASARLIRFADPRADRPGESISRLYLRHLGFAPPRLQVEVAGPAGQRYFVDFGLDDVTAFGEFDGDAKYTDPAFLGGRTPEQALRDEKEREDWIRGTTGRRVVRWTMRHLSSARALGNHLESFAIRP